MFQRAREFQEDRTERERVADVADLGAFDADDAVEGARRVVEEGDVDGRRRGRDPRAFRLRVDVEHVRLAREDGLLPKKKREKK